MKKSYHHLHEILSTFIFSPAHGISNVDTLQFHPHRHVWIVFLVLSALVIFFFFFVKKAMLLSSLVNVLVSRIRMFNLELSRKKKREFLHISCVWDQRLTTNFIYHMRPANYSHQHYRKFHLYWSASRSYLGALIFSFSYPCDHQRTIELGHRSCVQLFTSLDESGAALFVCFSLQGSSCHVAVRLFLSHEL